MYIIYKEMPYPEKTKKILKEMELEIEFDICQKNLSKRRQALPSLCRMEL